MEERFYHLTTEDIRRSRKLVREIFTKVIIARSLGKSAFDFTPKRADQRRDKTKVLTKA